MNLPGMTDQIADAILDWIDPDDAPRQFGAEADYYRGLNVPYAPRNGVPASLEELLLVRGVTRELLFGADANFNYQLEPQETRASGSSQSGARLTWAMLLSVHGGQRNLDPQGKPKINLNEKDLAKLHGQVSEVFGPEIARFVILYRQHGPQETTPGPTRVIRGKAATKTAKQAKAAKQPIIARGSAGSSQLDLSKPAKFELTCVLDPIGAKVAIPETASEDEPPEPIESPLSAEREAMRQYLPKWLDHTSITSQAVIRGRINVNGAPRAVLAAVPDLDSAMVEQIVIARRQRAAVEDPNRRHAAWLLTEGLVDLPTMKRLLPYLNAGGDVHRAQIVGYFDQSGPATRVELIVDATRTPPVRVYYKDLQMLGRGYSRDTLGADSP